MSSSCRRELQSRTPSLAASPEDFVHAKPNMCVLAAALEKFRARALGSPRVITRGRPGVMIAY